MSSLAAIALAAMVAVPPVQQPAGAARTQAGVDSVQRWIRERPMDARERLAALLTQAAAFPRRSDSLLRVGAHLAEGFAEVWGDSFPSRSVRWFQRLDARDRVAKIAADSVRRAGNSALGAEGIAAAMRLWREAHRRAQAIADTAGMAAALGNIAAGFYRASQLDSAEAYLTRARSLAQSAGDMRAAHNALRTLASVLFDRGDMARARATYQQALTDGLALGDVRGAASDHTNLGLIAAEAFDVAEARRHYDAAFALADQHGLDDAAATAMLNRANLESATFEYNAASTSYGVALARFQATSDSSGIALTRHNLGLLELRRGAYRSARVHLQAALETFDRVGTVEDQVQVQLDLAAAEGAMGNLHGAIAQLREAGQLAAAVPDAHGLSANVALARADVAVHLNTFGEADAEYGNAQALYRRAGDIVGELQAAQGRAALLIEREQFGRAVEQLEGISRAQQGIGDVRSAALTRLAIAHALREQRDLVGARRAAEAALDSLRRANDPVAVAAALAVLGEIEHDAASPVTAAAHFRAGIARVAETDVPTVSWQLHAGLARALRASGNGAAALEEFRRATRDLERMAGVLVLPERRATFLSDKWSVYADLALALRERGDAAAAFDASERLRARQMLDLLARGRITTHGADTVLPGRRQDLLVRIRELTERLEMQEGRMTAFRGPDLSSPSSAATREALSRAQDQYAQLMVEVRGDEDAVAAIVRGEVAPWPVVAARLARGQALLTYLLTDTASVVFVLTTDTMRVVNLGAGRAVLAATIDFARGTLARPTSAGTSAAPWRAPLRRLYQQLVAPVESAGLLTGVRELTIVPHAELHYLPFAALIREEAAGSEEFLIERYDVSYAPSASAFVRLGERASPSDSRVLALAPRPRDLPGSLEEVEAIRAAYGADATVLVGSAATERNFRSSVAAFGVVHLATYGVLNQHNPLFSFVELNGGGDDDGRLEVHEVFGLSLNARLLVLSACQTALASGAVSDIPAGDDWVGLVRAFLSAGATNVIATLWAVEDRATARLMDRLHRRLRLGDSEAAALSTAQRQMLRNASTSSPFYWAGFTLVGGR